ncbi:MAG: hypothetical protein R2728_05860 [Chitinophagales bacterium]
MVRFQQKKVKNFERIANEPELGKEIELFKLMEGFIGENKWPESTIELDHPKVKRNI